MGEREKLLERARRKDDEGRTVDPCRLRPDPPRGDFPADPTSFRVLTRISGLGFALLVVVLLGGTAGWMALRAFAIEGGDHRWPLLLGGLTALLVLGGAGAGAVLYRPFRGWTARCPFPVTGEWWRLTRDRYWRSAQVRVTLRAPCPEDIEVLRAALDLFVDRASRHQYAIDQASTTEITHFESWRIEGAVAARGEANHRVAFALYRFITGTLRRLHDEVPIEAVTIKVAPRHRYLPKFQMDWNN
jgi:hypothetical protein